MDKKSLGSTSCWSAIVVTTLLAGCGQRAQRYEVKGTVSLNGHVLSDGGIVFSAVNGSQSEGSTIVNGRYRVEVATGKYRVEINASKRKRNPHVQPGGKGEWYFASILPARYNEKTTLVIEVAAEPLPNCDFELATEADIARRN